VKKKFKFIRYRGKLPPYLFAEFEYVPVHSKKVKAQRDEI